MQLMLCVIYYFINDSSIISLLLCLLFNTFLFDVYILGYNSKDMVTLYNDDKEICVRTTEYYTLEPEIVNTGDNYKILKNKYGDVFGWNDMTAYRSVEKCKSN